MLSLNRVSGINIIFFCSFVLGYFKGKTQVKPLLSIQNLSVSFGKNEILHGISFDICPNEIVGIVGESGSGKSITSLALMRLLPKKASVGGAIHFQEREILSITDQKELRKIRGNQIAMIFQEPMSSLNPSLKCGYQIGEVLKSHTQFSKKAIKTEVLSLLKKVKFPEPERIYESYPHQISGGQKQRVMIAMAIACKPKLLIADEPTTALDATIQQEILSLLKELQQENQMAILLISHDLNVVGQVADKVLVMHQGNIIESGTTEQIFSSPQQTYTKALLAAKPNLKNRPKRLPTLSDFQLGNPQQILETREERFLRHTQLYAKPPLLRIENLEKTYFSQSSFFGKTTEFKAINGISLDIFEGETLGLVGESGCGKTTLGKTILQLEKAEKGQIFYRGKDITSLKGNQLKKLRKDIQIIFQDPYSSLNPKMKVGQAVMEPMEVHQLYDNSKNRKEKALEIFEKVGLDASHFERYPHQFSGGQRQRIGIARAIALSPKIIICDESVSALDISLQAQIINLLNELKEKQGFTYLFISHDLAVVKHISDRIAVMQKGIIEELNEADALYQNPQSAYTQKLISSFEV
ncbi:ABC transporter ATP-binding protein [Capnocytophaga canimorsus]|uniref:ABC transporter ATP-binding protein n=1 Tax=Capnocytophaga canimorsus TaxID=28188 RepID=UPI0037D3F237